MQNGIALADGVVKKPGRGSSRFLLEGFVFVVFAMPYLGLGVPAYFLAVLLAIITLRGQTKIAVGLIIFAVTALVVYLWKATLPDGQVLYRYAQVYFGFLIFYFGVVGFQEKISVDRLGLYCALMVIVEAILINTVISPTSLANFPVFDGALPPGHATKYFGFFQRPYGFCANATMTSTMLVVFYAMSHSRRTKGSLAIAILLSASTTGFMLLALVLFLKAKRKLLVLAIVLGAIGAFIAWFAVVDQNLAYRMSPAYIGLIADYTWRQFIDTLLPESFSVWIGSNYLIGGETVSLTDNGLAPFFYTNGLLICLPYIGAMFWGGARRDKVPFIVLFIGILHYPALFSLTGQLLFALLLTDKFSTEVKTLPSSSNPIPAVSHER